MFPGICLLLGPYHIHMRYMLVVAILSTYFDPWHPFVFTVLASPS